MAGGSPLSDTQARCGGYSTVPGCGLTRTRCSVLMNAGGSPAASTICAVQKTAEFVASTFKTPWPTVPVSKSMSEKKTAFKLVENVFVAPCGTARVDEPATVPRW